MHTIRKLLDGKAMEMFLHAGRFLLAVPMIIYGFEHFIFAKFVATLVPGWIPWHFFWTYFVGVALIAAGLAILVKRQTFLAAALLGGMIFAFVLLCHIPILARAHGDGMSGLFGDFAGRLANAAKDLGLSAAAFLFAGTQSKHWRNFGIDPFFTMGRILFSISILAFGVLHFLYPAYAPGIAPMFPSIIFPPPGHLFWVDFTAIIFLASGLCILLKKDLRLAGTVLGTMILLFALLTWGPRFAAHPFDIVGNWLKDIGVAGGAFILAASQKGTVERNARSTVGLSSVEQLQG
jgi:putative oxidoreductase